MPLALLGLWPLARSFLGGIITPVMNPMTWPAIALIAAGFYGCGWAKGDAHGDRQCEVRIARDKADQDRKIREEGETTFINLDRWLRDKDAQDELEKTLADEAGKDPGAKRACGGVGLMQRHNRIKGAAPR